MNNKYLLNLFLVVLFSACASQKPISPEYIYRYEIEPNFWNYYSDSTAVYELRFGPNKHITDAQQLLFEKFGKWNNTLEVYENSPFLIWENIKLFDWSDEHFYIGARSFDKTYEDNLSINQKRHKYQIKFCSVIAFNADGVDCLWEESPVRDSIAIYFVQETKKLKEGNPEFRKEIEYLMSSSKQKSFE